MLLRSLLLLTFSPVPPTTRIPVLPLESLMTAHPCSALIERASEIFAKWYFGKFWKQNESHRACFKGGIATHGLLVSPTWQQVSSVSWPALTSLIRVFPVVWKSNPIFTLFLSTRPRDCHACRPAIWLPPEDINCTKVEETKSCTRSWHQLKVFCAPFLRLGEVLFEKEGLRYVVYV